MILKPAFAGAPVTAKRLPKNTDVPLSALINTGPVARSTQYSFSDSEGRQFAGTYGLEVHAGSHGGCAATAMAVTASG